MRRLLPAITALLLFVVMSGTPTTGRANPQTQEPVEALTPERLSEYQAKLGQARTIQADSERRLFCLGILEKQVTTERNANEVRLGALRQREAQLRKDVESERVALADHTRNLDRELSIRDDLRNKRLVLEARRDAQERAVHQCKEKLKWTWIIGQASCELAAVALRLSGEFKNLDDDINAARRREEIARDSANAVQTKFDQTRGKLGAAEVDLLTTEQGIQVSEAKMVYLHKTRKNMTEHIYDNGEIIKDFSAALEESNTIELGTARRSTSMRVSELKKRIDTSIKSVAEEIKKIGENLPNDWMNSCPSR